MEHVSSSLANPVVLCISEGIYQLPSTQLLIMFYQVHGEMFRPLDGHLQVTEVHKIKITTALFKI
jgi:hypothetical protein